ncbi:MAG: hypothetical protein WC291_02630 [Thermodesulfovibrionales bacterium]
MKLMNLTPHAIVISLGDERFTVAPSGQVARVSSTPGATKSVDFGFGLVPVAESPTWGVVEGLPGPVEGTGYLVSGLVLSRCVGRADVFGPGTSPNDNAIRDDAGRIAAVTRLIGAPR